MQIKAIEDTGGKEAAIPYALLLYVGYTVSMGLTLSVLSASG
jgi:hypothetical protein